MESNNLICGICQESYNLSNRSPIHFPHYPPCATTYCRSCFNKVITTKGFNMKCPFDRQKLKLDAQGDIAPLPNYQLQEKLEKNKDYEVCPDHPNKFQKLFCKTDKRKICKSCHLCDGEKSHETHSVCSIERLKPEIEERRRLHEEGLKKSKIFEDAIQQAMHDKKKFFEEKIESQAKIHSLARLKTHLMVREYANNQKENVPKKLKENFESQEQTEEIIAGFKELRNLNIEHVLSQSPEKIIAQYDEGKFNRTFVECEEGMNQQAGELYERFGRIHDQEKISTALKFQSNLSIHLDGPKVKIVATNIMDTILIDAENFKEVTTMAIVFDAFDFNKEDMKVIEFVFSSVQHQLDSIELHYKNLQDTVTITKFETHIVLFSVMIFENPKNFKSITLAFENSDGSERYLRFLGETVFSEINLLESLDLTFKVPNIDEEVFVNFFHQAKPYLKGLKNLSLNIGGNLVSSRILDQEVVFELPNLESLNLAFNARNIFGRSIGTVVDDILFSIQNLKSCRICMEYSPKSELSFLKTISSFSEIESLVIVMPHSVFHEEELEYLKEKLKKRLKKLKTLDIFSTTFNHQNGLNQFLRSSSPRPQPSPRDHFYQNRSPNLYYG